MPVRLLRPNAAACSCAKSHGETGSSAPPPPDMVAVAREISRGPTAPVVRQPRVNSYGAPEPPDMAAIAREVSKGRRGDAA
jgi:hypothetical protein